MWPWRHWAVHITSYRVQGVARSLFNLDCSPGYSRATTRATQPFSLHSWRRAWRSVRRASPATEHTEICWRERSAARRGGRPSSHSSFDSSSSSLLQSSATPCSLHELRRPHGPARAQPRAAAARRGCCGRSAQLHVPGWPHYHRTAEGGSRATAGRAGACEGGGDAGQKRDETKPEPQDEALGRVNHSGSCGALSFATVSRDLLIPWCIFSAAAGTLLPSSSSPATISSS